MDRPTLERLLDLADSGRPFALAAIVARRGSVPARPGAAMIVEPNRTTGTIGGAELEWQAVEKARDCLAGGPGGRHTFDLWYRHPGGLDLACGGAVEVEILRPRIGPEDVSRARRRLLERRPFHWLIEGDRLRAAESPAAGSIPVVPPPHVLLAGGGHVHLALAAHLDALGYDHSVLDDRAQYASEARFPRALGRHPVRPREFFASAAAAGITHVVIAGYSTAFELEALDGALRRLDGFVGLIGSRAKRASFEKALAAQDVPRDRLARVECPLGIDVGAVTPAEIALSIAASIVRSCRPRATLEGRNFPVPGASKNR